MRKVTKKEEKYILVTASSKGIGLEIAKDLSFNGYNIILTSRNIENLQYAKNQLDQSLKHCIIAIDFSKDDIYEKLIKKIEHLCIVGIVHNYGINFHDNHPIDLEILNRSIYNNFLVSLQINNYFYDKLKGDPSKIIYIGSTASLHAKSSPSYVLSKSLINSYIKNISREYIKYNILICAILPGIIVHEGSDWNKKKKLDSTKYEEKKQAQPLKRFAMPCDISSYVVDLINQNSLLITGSLLKLDANEY